MPKGKRRGRGEGSVYRRQDGRWVVSLYLGRLPDGRPNLAREYAKTQREAVAKLQVLRERLRQGEPLIPAKDSLADYLRAWLDGAKKATVGAQTYRSYKSTIERRLIPTLGDKRLGELAPDDVARWIAGQLAAGRIRRDGTSRGPVAAATVYHAYSVLRAALNEALRWKLIARNVAALVSPPRVERPEVEPLSDDQARRLIRAIRGDPREALYLLCLACGVRKAEALGLRWRDVDLDGAVLDVRHQLQRVDGADRLPVPKGKRARRLTLPASVVDALRVHQVRQLVERSAPPDRTSPLADLVFTRPDGRPLSASGVTRGFQALLAREGLPRHRFHDLRHTCASLLIALGAHPREIADLLGHSQIAITMDLYGHVLESSRKRTAERMEGFLRGGEEPG